MHHLKVWRIIVNLNIIIPSSPVDSFCWSSFHFGIFYFLLKVSLKFFNVLSWFIYQDISQSFVKLNSFFNDSWVYTELIESLFEKDDWSFEIFWCNFEWFMILSNTLLVIWISDTFWISKKKHNFVWDHMFHFHVLEITTKYMIFHHFIDISIHNWLKEVVSV